LNTGCGGENLGLIREIQRRLPQTYNHEVVMSTVGNSLSDRSPDQCHYTVQGYSRIAEKLFPLVKKHIYDFPLSDELILPANIKKAYYTNTKQICLEFDKNIIIQQECIYPLPDSGKAYLKDYFFEQNKHPIGVSELETKSNKLYLNLSNSDHQVEKITYLPEVHSRIPSLYSGPWILTENNPQLGAYSFFEFPVEPPTIEEIPVQEEEVLVFPNPGIDNFTIRFRQQGQHFIALFDIYGNRILDFESFDPEINLDTYTFSSGAYLLKVEGEGVHFTRKIIVK